MGVLVYIQLGLHDRTSTSGTKGDNMAPPKVRALPDIIRVFKFQSQADDCWAVCIHNILAELSERLQKPSLKQSEARLNRAMGYGRSMGALSIRVSGVRPNLNRLLEPFGYKVEGRTDITLQGLEGIIADEHLSFPVCGLSYVYLKEKKSGRRLKIEGEPPPGLDHAVVVLKADSANVVLFDPLERFSKGGKGNDGLITLSAPTFLVYWSQESVERQWTMYIAPIPRRSVRQLEEFEGGQHASDD
jgi:hypothetical protein